MRNDGHKRTLLRGALIALLVSALSGCGLGFLASAPWIRSADYNDVAVLGDSIFALSGEIQEHLHGRAGGTFRNYTTSGAQLVGGSLAPSLFQQWSLARGDAATRVVLMDGGGNDILLPVFTQFDPYDCQTQWWEFGRLSTSCRNFIDDLVVDGVNLSNQMAADGVSDVVYLGYYYTKNGLLPAADLKEAIDYGDVRLAQGCANSVVSCSFVDPRSTIRRWDITSDGIHPDSSGSRKLADLIWPVLQPKL